MKIQLGTIVTNMAGSTGGQTVRRFKGGHVLQNKVLKKSKFQYNNGVRIAFNSKLFNQWNNLNESERAGWSSEATKYTFPDKFGNAKNLSGREFYLKLNAQLNLLAQRGIDVSSISSNLIAYAFEVIEMNFAGSFVRVAVDVTADGINYAFGVLPLKNEATNPNPSRAKVIGFTTGSDYNDYNLYPGIVSNFPWLGDGSWVLIVCWQINQSGFKSAPQYLKVQLS